MYIRAAVARVGFATARVCLASEKAIPGAVEVGPART